MLGSRCPLIAFTRPRQRPSRAKATAATGIHSSEEGTVCPSVTGEGTVDDIEPDDEIDDGNERAAVAFPFDRMIVQRLRETFPRARWSNGQKAWVVPGKTAQRRIDRWLAKEQSRVDLYAEAKGRDAFAFEPILSSYLSVDKDGFRIRTPYSRKLVEEIRQVPFARWDRDHKVWRVPFAFYDELVEHWQAIEAEARHCEPDERRKRAEARKGTEDERTTRRRIPLSANDLPPLDRLVVTPTYGIVVIAEITGEVAEGEDIADFYSTIPEDPVWGRWRTPTLEELVHTWPSRIADPDREGTTYRSTAIVIVIVADLDWLAYKRGSDGAAKAMAMVDAHIESSMSACHTTLSTSQRFGGGDIESSGAFLGRTGRGQR
jgi:hypothetical protein